MGPGPNLLTCVGSGQFLMLWSGWVSHLWICRYFPLKSQFFNLFSFRVKKISSGQVKNTRVKGGLRPLIYCGPKVCSEPISTLRRMCSLLSLTSIPIQLDLLYPYRGCHGIWLGIGGRVLGLNPRSGGTFRQSLTLGCQKNNKRFPAR